MIARLRTPLLLLVIVVSVALLTVIPFLAGEQ